MCCTERTRLYYLVVQAQVLGLGAITLFLFYCYYYVGLGFSGEKFAHFHPVFMMCGLIYLNGTSVTLYRVFSCFPTSKLKIVHACVQLLAMICVITGQVIRFKASPRHLFSLHSWVGLPTMALFVNQSIISVIMFLPIPIPTWVRNGFKIIHVWIGRAVLFTATVAALMGLNRENRATELTTSGALVNITGLCVLLFTLTVAKILLTDSYKHERAAYRAL